MVSGVQEVSIYSLPGGTLERRLQIEAPTLPSSPQASNAGGALRSTPLTYPRLALGGSYVVSASEMRVASDGKLLCTLVDERRISGDFYAAVGGDRLALIAGKMLKIYDLTVHSGYKRAYSESLGVSLDYLTEEEIMVQLQDALPNGPATHFLSWAWSYSLLTVTLALRTWRQEASIDPLQTFIWICFFCNNQERILKEKTKEGSDDLESTFQSRLQSIGRVLVLFDDWSHPKYLSLGMEPADRCRSVCTRCARGVTRVWCIFETFIAARAEISYTLIFPPESSRSLHETLQRGMHLEVTKDWSSIDVAQAKASHAVDEEKVKGLITRTSSFEEVNTVVKSHLVGWFKKQFEVIFEKGVQEGERDAEIQRLKEMLPAGSAYSAVKTLAQEL
eukprot:g6097.t1